MEDAKLEAEAREKRQREKQQEKQNQGKVSELDRNEEFMKLDTKTEPGMQNQDSQEEESSNSDDYVDVDDDEDSEDEDRQDRYSCFPFDLPKPTDKLPDGDFTNCFEINRAFLKTINEQKGVDPNGWQKLFDEFKDCMGRENNAFKAWALCQQRTAGAKGSGKGHRSANAKKSKHKASRRS